MVKDKVMAISVITITLTILSVSLVLILKVSGQAQYRPGGSIKERKMFSHFKILPFREQ